MDETEDRDDVEFQRYLALRKISHITRHGTVDGVEFDFRHDELDPHQWGMSIIANEGKFRETWDGQPFIWFPWYGVFDKDALRKKLEQGAPRPNKRQLDRELKENTPEIIVVAGDKIILDGVEILQLDKPFRHRHDAEVRLAFLKVVHANGRTVKLKAPIRLLGHTAFQLRGSLHNVLGKITARMLEHHGIGSLDDPKVRSIVDEGGGFAGAALLYLWMLVESNKHALSLVDELDSDDPGYGAAFATHQTIEQALLVGYYWANAEAQLKMEPLARSGLEALRGAKKAGIESGNRRRAKAEKTWKAHALELAQQARKDDPSLSQHRLAGEMTFKWKLETPPPGHTTLTNFISELEKAGTLPKRVRD